MACPAPTEEFPPSVAGKIGEKSSIFKGFVTFSLKREGISMTISKALAQINKQLSSKIDNALSKEVFSEVRDEEVATIENEVYGVYTPQIYRRRGEYGGLADPYNIEIQGGVAQGGKMSVVNVTDPNPSGCTSDARVTTGKDLPQLVEHGDGYKFHHYDFPSGGKYMQARPFTAKTTENLRKSKAHIAALKDGLTRQGIKVK